jgi:hypothetical protein
MSINDGLRALEMLKKKKEESAERRASEKIILIERRQISKNYPAIAQLQITFPDETQNNFKEYYNQQFTKFPLIADVHRLIKNNSQNYIIEIQSVKLMYTWFEFFIKNFTKDYEKDYLIEISGCWDKYDAKKCTG